MYFDHIIIKYFGERTAKNRVNMLLNTQQENKKYIILNLMKSGFI